MAKYLLSNGCFTEKADEYAIDYISLFLVEVYNDIPYMSFGNSIDVGINTKEDFILAVSSAIHAAVANLSEELPSVSISVRNIEYDAANNIFATIVVDSSTVTLKLG